MRNTLLDFLNSPDRVDTLDGLTPPDREVLRRQLLAYRFAVRSRAPASRRDRRLERLRGRDRASAVAAFATLREISEDKVADDFLSTDQKRKLMKAAIQQQPHLAPLVELVLAFERQHQPARGRRMLRVLASRRGDVAAHVRETAQSTWLELERHAATDRAVRGESIGRPERREPLSDVALRLSRRWRLQWARLPIARLRRCAWSRCAVVGGRLFLAVTSERDCPACRRSFSRDTRSRVRRGVTASPRRRL